jgi:NAD(P)-dependent dehydrogenase (short-subunit alcohol dehydrogenase family)
MAADKPTLDYTDKTVVITGGTGGIGLGLARGFVGAGATVIATGATGAEVGAAGQVGGVTFTVLDVRSDAAVEAFAAGVPSVDVLVNCAGVNLRAAEFTPEGFATTLDINLAGSMRTATAFRAKLAAGGTGAILNIASVCAFVGAPHAPAYAASKGGVALLTKSLAAAYAKEGIRVNALAPGWIETAMTAVPRANPKRSAELVDRTPMGRWGRPDDLVGPALFLCSPLAGFVTGAILPVDGGYTAT